MDVKTDSLPYFLVATNIICFVDHKLFLGSEKKLHLQGPVQVFKDPASNFGFTFTENLHCALIPSQLN